MFSEGFDPPDFISAIKISFWGQIQDGRRSRFLTVKKKKNFFLHFLSRFFVCINLDDWDSNYLKRINRVKSKSKAQNPGHL